MKSMSVGVGAWSLLAMLLGAPTASTAQTINDTPAVETFSAKDAGALTLPMARAMATAAEARAAENRTEVVVTVLDSGGHAVLLERMPGAQLASLALAQRKALSAVYYKRPSASFEAALAGGKEAVVALPDAMPAAGGIPIFAGTQLIGAIGVSGGSNAQDQLAAEAGMQAFEH